MRFQYLVFRTCFVLALLGGCTSTTGLTDYPTKWAPLDSSTINGNCPNISGSYSNQSSGGFPTQTNTPPSLSKIFASLTHGSAHLTSPSITKQTWLDGTNISSVTFKQEAETLTVMFKLNTGEEKSLNFRRYHFKWSEEQYDDLFTCYASETGSRIRFFAEPESHNIQIPNVYIEGGGTLVFLLKSTDGSLIVQWRSESLGISAFIIGSHMSFNSLWWKYSPIN